MEIKSVKVGEIRVLKNNNHKVRITHVRDTSYAFPIWYCDEETAQPNGCKVKDLKPKTVKHTRIKKPFTEKGILVEKCSEAARKIIQRDYNLMKNEERERVY